MSTELSNRTLTRKIVDASTEDKDQTSDVGRVRAGGIRHRKIPFRQQPAAIAEIVGLQIAGLRALARQGVVLDAEEIDRLEKLARTVNSLSAAQQRLNKPDDEDPSKMTDEQLKRKAGL